MPMRWAPKTLTIEEMAKLAKAADPPDWPIKKEETP